MPVFTLDNFEELTDDTILTRGSRYYKQGKVIDLLETETGYEASVAGTNEYQVEVEILENNEVRLSCSCPYDQGPICKHQVAVLIAINKGTHQPKSRKRAKPGDRTNSPTVNKQTKLDKLISQAKQAICKMSEQQKDEYIFNSLEDNPAALERFIACYSDHQLSASFYKKQIQADISCAKKYGCIDYHSASTASESSEAFLHEACLLQNQGQHQQAIIIAQAVIESMVPVLSHADDSDGILGGQIEMAIEVLEGSATQLTANEQQTLIKYLIAEALSKRQRGWNWSWDLLKIAGSLVKDAKQEKQLQDAFLQKYQQRELDDTTDIFMLRIDKTEAKKIEAQIVKRLRPQEYQSFLDDHLDIPELRMELVELLIEQNQLERAKQLCKAMIEEGSFRRDQEWLEKLLQIAKIEADLPTWRKMLEELLRTTHNLDYFDQLKELVPRKDWQQTLFQVIKQEHQDKTYTLFSFGDSLVAQIYQHEQMWDELMELTEKEKELIDDYRQDLEPRYPKRCTAIYKTIVQENLEKQANRKNYATQCRYLRRIKKMGLFDEAEEIVAKPVSYTHLTLPTKRIV